MKNKIIVIALISLFIVLLFKMFTTNPAVSGVPESEAQVILYWGIGCPHCDNVKEYIKSKKVDTKVKIALKETYYNKQNQQDLNATATSCQVDTTQGIGVPFAYFKADNQCLMGDQPIIDKLDSMMLE